ncbi:MAG: hypothetical protein HY840_08695 [Bacteroidetes bacterium]|nr:hypothetical protein [Bacteroidota bacterium]
MKILKNIITFLLFLGLTFFSCKRDKDPHPTDFGYNYFPINIGHYVIYQVDSIWQDDLSKIDTTYSYQLKELIAASFLDNSNRPTLRIERYYKFYNKNIPYDSMQWSVPKIWYANRTTSTAERVEANIRYLKLIFPVQQGKQWDGNVYNMFGYKKYKIISADQPESVGAMHFDSVVTVTQANDKNFVLSQVEQEKFARNVGLIYKQNDSLTMQGGGNFSDTVGYRFSMKVIEFGK